MVSHTLALRRCSTLLDRRADPQPLALLGRLVIPWHVHITLEMLKTILTTEGSQGGQIVCVEGEGRETVRGRTGQWAKRSSWPMGSTPVSPGLSWKGSPGLLTPQVLVRGRAASPLHTVDGGLGGSQGS